MPRRRPAYLKAARVVWGGSGGLLQLKEAVSTERTEAEKCVWLRPRSGVGRIACQKGEISEFHYFQFSYVIFDVHGQNQIIPQTILIQLTDFGISSFLDANPKCDMNVSVYVKMAQTR